MCITSEPLTPPVVPPEHLQAYSALVEYLGLSCLLHGCQDAMVMKAVGGGSEISDGVRVGSNWCTVGHRGSSYVSQDTLSDKSMVWKVVLGGNVDNYCSVFVGVAARTDDEL